jgi:hypothetical protein
MTAIPGEGTLAALASALDRARNLARDAALARDADLACDDGYFVGDSSLVLALDRAFGFALARAGESRDALAVARALALARDRARDRGSSPDLARDLDLAFDLVRDLDLAFDLTSGSALASDPDLGHARDLPPDADRAGGREVPRVAPTAGRLVVAATRLLPVRERARYTEEFESELWDIAQAGGGRRAQLAYAARQVMAARRLRTGLRVPRRRGAVPRRAR